MKFKDYISELKRRNVFKSGIAYIIMSWILIQVSAIFLNAFDAPDFVFKTILLIIGIGFPVWLIFAWVYELTPEGLKKTDQVDKQVSITSQTSNRLSKVIIVLLIIAIIMVIIDQFWNQETIKKTDSIENFASMNHMKKAIAVLPFLNYSKNEDQNYLADGITEAITLELGKNDSLRVISRTSAMSFKNSGKLSSEIARELEADYLLEGSVLFGIDSIRVNVQLIQPFPKEKHIWSNSYNQKVENILQLISKISNDIANEVNTVMIPGKKFSLVNKVNATAYDLYLKGLHLWRQQQDESIKSSIAFLKESIAIDSSFAPAYVTLAEAYISQNKYVNNNEDKPINRERSRKAINKAIELDKDLGAAYITKGNILGKFDWNWADMKIMLDKGLKLDPNNAYGHMLLSDYYLVNSNFKMAIHEALIAEKLDPLNPMIGICVGEKYYMAGNYEKSIKQYQNVLYLFPSDGNAWSQLGFVQYMNGQKEDAKNTWIRLQEIKGNDTMIKAYKQESFENALKFWLYSVKKEDPKFCTSPTLIAQVNMLVNDKEEALKYLEIAYKYHNEYLPIMLFSPDFKNLHNEPRFKKLVTKTGVIMKN